MNNRASISSLYWYNSTNTDGSRSSRQNSRAQSSETACMSILLVKYKDRCVCVYIYILYVLICMYVCMYVYSYIYIYIYACTYNYINKYIYN